MSAIGEETIGLLASGGLDSCILMGHLARQGRTVQPFYIRSGLHWEGVELESLQGFISALASPRVKELVVLDLPLTDVYGSHWSVDGKLVPDASTPDEAVFLPGRNPLLLIKPALWCQLHGIEQLALAVLASNPFPDATPEFFAAYGTTMQMATGKRLRIERPFAELHKAQVMPLGREMPLERTFSCISPREGLHCGQCNKCAERQSAFKAAAMPDPTEYHHSR